MKLGEFTAQTGRKWNVVAWFPLERYFTRKKIDECWPWKGTVDKDGYGLMSAEDDEGNKSKIRAIRFIYEYYIGPIPPGLVVRHTCDNPNCVNWRKHLILGTPAENKQDSIDRGRVPRGPMHHLFGKKQPKYVGEAVAASNRRRKQPTGPDGRFVSKEKARAELERAS